MSGGHSVIAPSGLHQIVQCPGSIRMQAPYPEPPDSRAAIAAAEGTAAHWVMAEFMAERDVEVGQKADNGVIVTQEMIEGADLLVNDVLATVTPHGLSLADCITEVPVDISRVHPLCWGTPDVRVWLPGKQLVVWDLKFGYRWVPAFENLQLLAYSTGCADAAGHHDLDVRVINRIVQPRSYDGSGPVREWRYRLAGERALVNVMNMAAIEALGDNPKTRVGPACQDCRARHACPTLQRSGEAAMDVSGSAVPQDLTPAALGTELRYIRRALKLLEARAEGLEEQAAASIRRGQRVPHFRLETADGRLDWTKPGAEVIALGQMLGHNYAKPPEAITPLQAKARGLPESLIATYAKRKPSAAKLVADDGSRERQIFG